MRVSFREHLGAQYVSVASPRDLRTAEGFLEMNLPGRDQKIEDYKQYLRNLKAGGDPLQLIEVGVPTELRF